MGGEGFSVILIFLFVLVYNFEIFSKQPALLCDKTNSKQHRITWKAWAHAYLTTLLLHASSLIRKARAEAFCAGVWAWKALVFRLSVSSVCPQWASMKICKISETLSRFTPTFSKCSPRAVLAYKMLTFLSVLVITIHHIKQYNF